MIIRGSTSSSACLALKCTALNLSLKIEISVRYVYLKEIVISTIIRQYFAQRDIRFRHFLLLPSSSDDLNHYLLFGNNLFCKTHLKVLLKIG